MGQLITPWGVGSMVNFPHDETLMVCGLDAWENVYRQARDGYHEFIIREERLERRLGVRNFRRPPDFREPVTGIKIPDLKYLHPFSKIALLSTMRFHDKTINLW